MEWFLTVMINLLVLAIALAAVRLVRGPRLVNRVIALDVIAVLGAALTALLAIKFDQQVFLDVTIVLALISFIGTVAFAYYVEKGAR